MTDEDSEGVSRRNALYLLGGTSVATGVSGLSLKYIIDNFLTSDRSDSRQGNNNADNSRGQNYGDWRDGIPSGCELPSSYAEDVESYIDEDVEDMDSSMMDQYVDSGRVAFEKDGTELGLLVDQDNDGQYDDSYSGNFEDLCT